MEPRSGAQQEAPALGSVLNEENDGAMSREMAIFVVGMFDLGSLYALVGVGFVILYRSTRVLNFAQGAFMLIGAEVFTTLVVTDHITWWFALPISMVATSVFGSIIYVVFFRRLVGAEPFVLVIASLGLNIVLVAASDMAWGPSTRLLPSLISRNALFTAGGVSLEPFDLFSILFPIVVIVALELQLRHTRLGTQMRAVADSPLFASQTRISVHRISAIAWMIAAGCGAGAGIIYAIGNGVSPEPLETLGIFVFPAVFLGGLDSIKGALVGGYLLALLQNGTTYYISGTYTVVVPFLVLIVVLLVRPTGIFGSREVVRL